MQKPSQACSNMKRLTLSDYGIHLGADTSKLGRTQYNLTTGGKYWLADFFNIPPSCFRDQYNIWLTDTTAHELLVFLVFVHDSYPFCAVVNKNKQTIVYGIETLTEDVLEHLQDGSNTQLICNHYKR